jgi:hypothetical protein
MDENTSGSSEGLAGSDRTVIPRTDDIDIVKT